GRQGDDAQEHDRGGCDESRPPAPPGRRQPPGRGDQQGQAVAGHRHDDGGGHVPGDPAGGGGGVGHPVVGGGGQGHAGRSQRQPEGQQQPNHRGAGPAGG